MTWETELKRQIKDFDLLKCSEVRRLCLLLVEGGGVELHLETVHANLHKIEFVFQRVRDVNFPRMPGGLLSLGELAIVDVRAYGWEGIRFRVGDELSGLNFNCANITIAAVDQI